MDYQSMLMMMMLQMMMQERQKDRDPSLADTSDAASEPVRMAVQPLGG